MLCPRAFVAAVLCCLTLAASRPCLAAVDPAQGKAAFDEGQRRFLAGDYREALAWFEKGYLFTDDAAFLLNIAQCQRLLGAPKEALVMYRLYLKSTPEWANREGRAVATKAIRELDSEAAGAPAAGAASTPPGPALPPAAAEPMPASAGKAGRKFKEAPSAYPVFVSAPELDAKRASATTPTDNAAATARRLRLAGLVCGATGLASLGVGLYYWTRATSHSDSANSAAVFNQADYDQGKRAETMQWIFYSVGAAAVAAGSALYLYGRWRPAAKKSSFGLLPVVGPGVAGLAARGAL